MGAWDALVSWGAIGKVLMHDLDVLGGRILHPKMAQFRPFREVTRHRTVGALFGTSEHTRYVRASPENLDYAQDLSLDPLDDP